MNIKEYKCSQYRSHWQNGSYWLSMATTLKAAADKIFDVWMNACKRYENLKEEDGYLVTDDYIITIDREMLLFPVYMLLMGYALENLVKGIIISEMRRIDPKSIDRENLGDLLLPWKDGVGKCSITTHIFKHLFNIKYCNINLPNEEMRLLEEIEEYVLSGGKYPTPKKFNGSFTNNTDLVVMDYDRRQKPINALYSKLWTRLSESDLPHV
ncbi:MAG: hypothetical protein WA137_05205 [Methanothrix sp.]